MNPISQGLGAWTQLLDTSEEKPYLSQFRFPGALYREKGEISVSKVPFRQPRIADKQDNRKN